MNTVFVGVRITLGSILRSAFSRSLPSRLAKSVLLRTETALKPFPPKTVNTHTERISGVSSWQLELPFYGQFS